MRPSTLKEVDESLMKGPGRAGIERPAKGGYIYTAHMGQVQLFVEVKDNPDDSFTDPPGLETTTPSFLYSDDSGDSDDDLDEESDEGDEHDDEESNERDEEGEDDDGDERGGTSHPYRFTVDPTLEAENRRVEALGQNASYANVLLTRQFRTYIFSLSISGRYVRFLRWDRSGVTVSQAVDYVGNPLPLATFLWALVSATASERGWDTSAQPSRDPNDEIVFRSRITEHVMDQLGMKDGDLKLEEEVNKHYEERIITKLVIPSMKPGKFVQVLVSQPCFTLHSLIGRSTRGFWGVMVNEITKVLEVVLVKDVWRPNVEGIEHEGDILCRLHEKGVGNIPPLIVHGDVKDDDGEFHLARLFSL